MVELSVSLMVLVVGVTGTLSTIASTAAVSDSARETNLAYLEAQQAVEQLRNIDFDEVVARYNDDTTDDPAGKTSPGSTLDLTEGELAEHGDATVTVLFPYLDETTAKVGEDLLGVKTRGGAGEDVLTVQVRVEWTGTSGNRLVELETILRRP